MARVLVTVHLGRHFRIFGHYDYKVLLSLGHEVHIAANFNEELDCFDDPHVTKHQIDFIRNPFSVGNFRAIRQLEKLFKDIHFDLIHCQSPSGGAVTRIAARQMRNKGTKILYTAHGLHFFDGAPHINWLLYYNVEKWLGRYTDCIITINDEDYLSARYKLGITDVHHIHGVGINLGKFIAQTPEKKRTIRKQLGYADQDFILICVGELSYRKHQDLLIEAISLLKDKISNIKLLLVGVGSLTEQYKDQVRRQGLNNHVEFLGYRKDIADLMMISDVAVSASRQEGLPVNVMEAMATGLPLVVTNCRGNRDLINNDCNGYIVEIGDPKNFSKAIEKLYFSEDLRRRLAQENLRIIKKYSCDNIFGEMTRIYSKLCSH